jgi:hypothetical protein
MKSENDYSQGKRGAVLREYIFFSSHPPHPFGLAQSQ